jgi:hypothetical protein
MNPRSFMVKVKVKVITFTYFAVEIPNDDNFECASLKHSVAKRFEGSGCSREILFSDVVYKSPYFSFSFYSL